MISAVGLQPTRRARRSHPCRPVARRLPAGAGGQAGDCERRDGAPRAEGGAGGGGVHGRRGGGGARWPWPRSAKSLRGPPWRRVVSRQPTEERRCSGLLQGLFSAEDGGAGGFSCRLFRCYMLPIVRAAGSVLDALLRRRRRRRLLVVAAGARRRTVRRHFRRAGSRGWRDPLHVHRLQRSRAAIPVRDSSGQAAGCPTAPHPEPGAKEGEQHQHNNRPQTSAVAASGHITLRKSAFIKESAAAVSHSRFVYHPSGCRTIMQGIVIARAPVSGRRVSAQNSPKQRTRCIRDSNAFRTSISLLHAQEMLTPTRSFPITCRRPTCRVPTRLPITVCSADAQPKAGKGATKWADLRVSYQVRARRRDMSTHLTMMMLRLCERRSSPPSLRRESPGLTASRRRWRLMRAACPSLSTSSRTPSRHEAPSLYATLLRSAARTRLPPRSSTGRLNRADPRLHSYPEHHSSASVTASRPRRLWSSSSSTAPSCRSRTRSGCAPSGGGGGPTTAGHRARFADRH